MGTLGEYYVIIPALFWFIVVVVALVFVVIGVVAGYSIGRSSARFSDLYPAEHRRIPADWPGGSS